MIDNDLLTIKEAAEYLRISIQTLRRAVWSNRISAYRVGNHPKPNHRPIRFTKEILDQFAGKQ